ncbi:hypothetical protein TKK_0008227 [Trichogramma kaykai]|uniref:Bromo domain-containing protein n=1 Tax=Trichogramma kaykai TaxID=54128 RepID=A0ABD2X4C6_9HYME
MSQEEAVDSMDTEDSDEEEIFDGRHLRKSLRSSLRSQNHSAQESHSNNLNIRRSTRKKLQTYENLNSSWIFGTQTLKGYPMYKKQSSSSDKEMADEDSSHAPRMKRRSSLRSHENLSPKGSSRHLSNNHSLNSSRELRTRSRLRGHSNRDHLEDEDFHRELMERPDRSLRKLSDHHEHDLPETTERSQRSSEPCERELRNKSQLKLRNSHGDKNDKERDGQNKTDTKVKVEIKDNKSDVKTNEERELRSGTLRTREGPVTRQRNNGKSTPKVEENDEEDEEDDQESDKAGKDENNENSENEGNEGFTDMYSRVKRPRRTSTRVRQKRQLAEDSDMSESTDEPGPRKYSLRQKKPTVEKFQIRNEPVRRSMRERRFRDMYSTAARRRKHRSKTSSSSDSSDSEAQCYKSKNKKNRQSSNPQGAPSTSDRKADISPISVDSDITFNDVGGLESHVHCLKEMVVFPMVYSNVFERFHVTPPKGVLFHGPPGTGKTLIARALANECSKGSRKVSFFMRKGADCLTKWVGESERQLRLLFEQAQQMKPSIIFFDEIDGLAPVRSTKQDQIHASIVSTLLALMDGLNNRGEVIVIGATNRIDAIDPALRRPGRFDRELFFPLPSMKERLEILKIHMKKWGNPPDDQLLQVLADKSTGYCGSDLKALCTEAVIQGLKRTYPQIYLTNNRLLLNPTKVEVKKEDFEKASSLLVPASHRVTPAIGQKLLPFMEPLLEPVLQELISIVQEIFPQGMNPALAKTKTTKGIHRPRLVITGGTKARNQSPQLAKALLYHMEHLAIHNLNVSTLFSESARSPEETCVQVFNEASRNVPSVIYVEGIDQWWPLVPETVKAVFLCRISSLSPTLPIFILTSSEVDYEELPEQIQQLFSQLRGEVYNIPGTTEEQRVKFFKPIFTTMSLRPPVIKLKNLEALEELPLAPDPEPKKLSPKELKILHEQQEVSLRQLRIFLREICAKLARNKQFYMFTQPVDTEEAPDYNDIISHPMDLETMMTKIDMHLYMCARDFLDDVDLICANALEYNPARNPADKLIRHRACSLRDNAYALIKAEMDSDFEDACQEISKTRKMQNNPESTSKESNENCPSADAKADESSHNGEKHRESDVGTTAVNGRTSTNSRKRRLKSSWARGFVKKVHKKKKITFEDGSSGVVDQEETEQGTTQEFETETTIVLNGHISDNSESDHDSNNETAQKPETNIQNDQPDQPNEQETTTKSTSEVLPITTNVEVADEEEESQHENVNENLKENAENVSYSFDSDYDQLTFNIEDSESVLIDRDELENGYAYTVKATADFPIDLLCDAYVQLRRRVAQYSKVHDRKMLPKELMEDVKSFEKYHTLEQ